MAISKCISLSAENRLGVSAAGDSFRIDETGTHGTPEFPVALYLDDVTTKYVNWHWHEEFEAGYVTDGCVTVSCGNRKYQLTEGDVFFVNSSVLHAMHNTTPSRPAVFRSVAFAGSVIGGAAGSVFSRKYLLPILHGAACRDFVIRAGEGQHAEILAILRRVWDEVSLEAEDHELTVRSELSRLFACILKRMPNADGTDRSAPQYVQENRVRQLLDYIHANYRQCLTLETLAQATAVSKTEVMRCFRQIIGQSPIQYLKTYRLQRAAYLLTHTDHAIGQIGLECGFEDGSYFTRSFHAMFHCTPQDYRKAGGKGE